MRRPLAALALATAFGGASVAPASAEQILPQNSGLTEPGGVVRTPDGAIWATDGLKGVCKVNVARNGLVADRFCAPENEAVPAATPGPSAAFDLAFDEESSSFYVAEGSSNSAGVWRMRWTPGAPEVPESGTITSAERVVDIFGDRVMGLALGRVPGPGGVGTTLEVDFTTKDSRIVQRITGADTAAPVTLPVAMTAQDVEVAAIARLNGDLYLGEPVAGITRVDDPGGPDPKAVVVPGLGGVHAGALAADQTRNRLYVGTDSGTGADEVLALNVASGAAETYAAGLASITALGLEADGALLAADDPATAAGGVGVVGGGRVFRFGLLPLARPSVALTASPPAIGTARSVTFSYASRSDATFECTVDAVAQACPSTGGAGTVTLDVLDGTHEFAIRAVAPDGATTVAGQSIRHVFTVDTTAPEVSIDNPAADRRIERRTLDLDFTSNEAGATFTCAVDGAAPAPCGSPLRLRDLALGGHTVQVWATDRVGHTTAAPAEWAFEVADPPPPPPVVVAPNDGGPGTSGPVSSGPGGGTAPPDEPRRRTETSRNDPCKASVTTRLDFRRPPAVVRVSFPSTVRTSFVRMAILKKRPGRAPVKVATMHRELRGGSACATATWGLWRREGRKLRTGTYLLRVHAGASRSTVKQVWLGGLRVRR